jgi:DnaK suppressor protein
MLTPREVRHFRGKLEAERKAVEARLAARSRDEQETIREESGVGDSADEAFLIYDRESDIDDNDLDRSTLVQIDRALRRLDEGTYGVSEVSGKPIPVERLEAVPYATTLIDEQPLEPA